MHVGPAPAAALSALRPVTPILVLDSSDDDTGPASRESGAHGHRASTVRLS
jgi:hypothetical protein